MKRRILLSILFVASVLFGRNEAKAQSFGIKTNLLYDATTTLNLGVEIGLAPKWTLDISGNYNGWEEFPDKLIKHAMVQPEFRYWFCDRFSRHFLGFHAIGGIYNVGNIINDFKVGSLDFSPLTNQRFEGWGAGAGISYGYAFILGKHWNLELQLGAGYIYTEYDKFQCVKCGKRLESDVTYHYFGPTKANIGLVYLF